MKKLSFFIVLAVVYNGSAFGMVDPVSIELQHRVEQDEPLPSLEGRLKPIANFLDHNLERYYTYEESNPTIANLALRGTWTLSQALCVALPEVIGGSRVIYGGVRAAQGLLMFRRIHDSTSPDTRGESPTLAPLLMQLDTSLNQRKAEILSIFIKLPIMSFSEFEAKIKGMRQALPVDERSLQNGHDAYEYIRRISQEHQAVSTVATTRVEREAEKILDQSGHDLTALLTETVQEHVREYIPKSRQIGLLERQTAQPGAAQYMQDLFAMAIENRNYEIARNTVADTFAGFSAIMSIAGNRKAAYQIATVGNAGIKIMDSCRMLSTGASALATGTSALTGLGGAGMTASYICPYVGIACAVASLVSLCADDGSDGLGEALSQIHQSVVQMHHSLSQQIFVVHEHMMERFDNLESKVDSMHVHMVQGFLSVLEHCNYLRQDVRDMHANMIQGFLGVSQGLSRISRGIVGLSQQMQDSTASIAYSLEHIHSDLQTLHDVNAKVESLQKSPFAKSCAAIKFYIDRRGSLSSMPEQTMYDLCEILENILLGKDPTFDCLNGFVCTDFSPDTMNRILGSHSPESILGYYGNYLTSQLGLTLPPEVKLAKLPNIGLFVYALQKYLTLRKATMHFPYDRQCNMLRRITRVGDHALTFIDALRDDTVLHRKLYDHYNACHAQVLSLYSWALEKKSQELLDAVHDNAVEKTGQAIGDFPACLVNQEGPEGERLRELSLCNQNAAKNELRSTLEWIAQNKSQFKVDLAQSVEELLANPDNTILNGIALPKSSCNAQYQPIPLDWRLKAPILGNCICKHAVIAERLGLGTIEVKYVVNPDDTILVKATFRKKDNTELSAGSVLLAVPSCSVGSVFSVNSLQTRRRTHDHIIVLFQEAVCRLKSIWQNVIPRATAQDNPDLVSLVAVISSGLIEQRREALDSLSADTVLGIGYKQAVKKLQSSYRAIQDFETIVGRCRPEIQRIPDPVVSYLHDCTQFVTAGTNLRSWLEGTAGLTPPTRIIPARADNPFSEPLRNSLARSGHFATIYSEIAR